VHTWKNSMVLHNRYHSQGWLSWPISKLRWGNSNVNIIRDQLKLVEKMHTFRLDPTLLNLEVISFTFIRLQMWTWLAQNYLKKKMNSGQTICRLPSIPNNAFWTWIRWHFVYVNHQKIMVFNLEFGQN
jgi:hypothetical protein